jgi:Bacterial Ig domain/Bacterial Ig-like domain/FG-GAP-like repeat
MMKRLFMLMALALMVGAAMALSGVASAASSVTFTPVEGSPFKVESGTSNVAANPWGTATADFNADGKNDLAVSKSNNGIVSVLLNKGDGTGSFFPATNFAVGSFPIAITSADFDGIHGPDLAVANFISGNVSVLLNKGDGTGSFFPATNFPAGTQLTAITSADFDEINGPDLAVTNQNTDTVSVLLNDGTGSLGTAQTFAVGDQPNAITSADFDGTSQPDLAVANNGSDNVSVLLYDNQGGFIAATGSPFAVGDQPRAITSANFDGTGLPDLAVANYGSDNVSVLKATTNSAPTANPDPNYSVAQGGSLAVPREDGVLANDTDTENDPLTATIVSGPTNGMLTTQAADGSFTYTPNTGFSGSDSFTYKANDGKLDSNTATVTITVTQAADTTAPKVTNTTVPAAGTTRVAPGVNVTATFTEAMDAITTDGDPSTISGTTFKLMRAGTTTAIGAVVSYDATANKATLNPNANLRLGTKYKAVVTTKAEDLAGNQLDQNSNQSGLQQKGWTFTTRN